MGVFERAPPASRIDLAEEPEFNLGGMKAIPAERAVMFGDVRRALQPRVMKVLVSLAKSSPAVVSRDRLIEQCWDGRIVGDDALNRCILALRHLAQQFEPAPFSIETIPRVGHRLVESGSSEGATASRPTGNQPWWMPVGVLVALLVGVALLWSRPWEERPHVPTIMVGAAAPDAQTRELANDLTVKLGSLETAPSTSLRLISDEGSHEKPDLLLDVSRIPDSAALGANLVLRSGSDRSILWSEELKQPSGDLADLKLQVAFTAARVLGCAAEATAPQGKQLSQRTLKLYLNGCAAQADLVGREAESVIPIFREVLRNAPQFEGAWAKLLWADSDVFMHLGSTHARERLKADLAAARKINPNLPDAYLAQAVLVPDSEYAEKLRLVNRAIELEPDNSDAYAVRAAVLQLVGRMKDAIVEARRAMQLDPLSPGTRNGYILALAVAGHSDTARQELQNAERLWPGASSVAGMRATFNLRFGDPREAWDYFRKDPSADWMNARSYLEARADRTPAKIERALQDAEKLYRRHPRSLQHLIQVYGEFDRNGQLLELLLKAPEAELILVDMTFRAPSVDFWHDPRALRVAQRAGLLDYWRSSGQWPDFCFRSDLPYDCKAEAAKIVN